MRRTALLLFLLLTLGGWAQTPTPVTPTPVTTPSVEVTPPDATPVALPDLSTQLESSRATIAQFQADLETNTAIEDIDRALNELTPELQRRKQQVRVELAQSPSADELHQLEQNTLATSTTLSGWKTTLSTRLTTLDSDLTQMSNLRDTWRATSEANSSAPLPAELLHQIAQLQLDLGRISEKAIDVRARDLVLMTRIASQETLVTGMLASLSQAREQKVRQILVHDSVPIWKVDVTEELGHFGPDFLRSLAAQLESLARYLAAHPQNFGYHLLCLLVLIFSLQLASSHIQPWLENEPDLTRAARIFAAPMATGMLLSVLVSPLFYPDPPTLLIACMGLAALVPANLVLRPIIDPPRRPVLNALVIFFCIDQVRILIQAQVVMTRLVFDAEMLGGLVFAVWLRRSPGAQNLGPNVRAYSRAARFIFVLALLATNIGYLQLGYLVGDAGLKSAYLALVIQAMLEVLGGLTAVALRVPPLALLKSVSQNRQLVRLYLRRWVHRLGALVWFLGALQFLGISQLFFRAFGAVFSAGFTIGSLHLSVGQLLIVPLAFWIPLRFSRVLRFVLSSDVYPYLSLDRGVSYTLSTLVYYLFLLVGFLLALAALGIETTHFTIVAGALGVGVGFGLQNIVNNFVSGLILLFERPVKVGDIIQIGDTPGSLQRIGLRACVVRTADGAEIIVPNGDILSQRVTNWTLSDTRRRLTVNVGVGYESDTNRVMELLKGVAADHPHVLDIPAPEVLLLRLGASSLDFQLQAWTESSTLVPRLTSELTLEVLRVLTEAAISVPFPTQSLRVESLPGGMDPMARGTSAPAAGDRPKN